MRERDVDDGTQVSGPSNRIGGVGKEQERSRYGGYWEWGMQLRTWWFEMSV